MMTLRARDRKTGAKHLLTVSGWFGLVLLAGLLGPMLARAAGPLYWDWPADQSFGELEFYGAALDQDGMLTTGLSVRQMSFEAGPAEADAEPTEGPEVYWRSVADGRGGAYVATGHGGQLLHV